MPMSLCRFLSAAAIVAAAAMLQPAAAAEPYRINVVLSATGSGSFLGAGERQSLELAAKAINESGGIAGQPVEFVYHDDQSNPQIAVQLASAVVAEKPAVLIGSSLVASCRAMAPLMKSGPVQYCLSPGLHPDAGSYSFTASVSTFDLAALTIRYFRMKGWTRIAFLFSIDATGQDFEAGIKQVLAMPENKGVEAVAQQHFNITDVSVAAQIQNIKDAKPQAFIAWSTGTPIATVFHGMTQAGLDVPMATTDGNMTYVQMKNYADFLPKQLYFPAGEYVIRDPSLVPPDVAKAQADFYRLFASIKAKPDEPSELAWEPAMILAHALRTLGPQASAQQVRDFIVHLKGFPSIDGTYDFVKVPQRGLDVTNAVMTLWNPQAQAWNVVSKPAGEPLQ